MKKHKISAGLLLFTGIAMLISEKAAAVNGPADALLKVSGCIALGSSPKFTLIGLGGIILMIFIAISVTVVKKLRQDRAERRNTKSGHSIYKHTAASQQEDVRYCPHCGSRQLTRSPFCGKCGKLTK